MSHVVVIIQRQTPFSTEEADSQLTYSYSIPVPHDATPAQVGEMVRKAYKRLEGADD